MSIYYFLKCKNLNRKNPPEIFFKNNEKSWNCYQRRGTYYYYLVCYCWYPILTSKRIIGTNLFVAAHLTKGKDYGWSELKFFLGKMSTFTMFENQWIYWDPRKHLFIPVPFKSGGNQRQLRAKIVTTNGARSSLKA